MTLVVALGLAGCANDDQRCQNYGYEPGSDGYANCRMTLQDQHQRMFMHGMDMLAAPQQRPVTCTGYGNSVTCY